ncbi:helix-turn-helix domain-containing protein [Vagococcus fluvialis]|uniref:helix-turn-helix domain-containing protein n=1 Tax=Vagococcus fluvialis TaxID=2738 RepID=UPI003B5D005E
MSLQEDVARNFRVMLAERQMKKSDIFKKTGIARSTLYHLESADNVGIQFETIEKVAEALNIEPYELFKTKKSS